MNNPIVQLRKTLGFSPLDFATLLGIAQTTIYSVENGVPRNPRAVFEAIGDKNLVMDMKKLKEDYRIWWQGKEETKRERLVSRMNQQ